jgi:hypothetical protein
MIEMGVHGTYVSTSNIKDYAVTKSKLDINNSVKYMEKISEVKLTTDGEINFENIPRNYDTLSIEIIGSGIAHTGLNIQINRDTEMFYSYQQFYIEFGEMHIFRTILERNIQIGKIPPPHERGYYKVSIVNKEFAEKTIISEGGYGDYLAMCVGSWKRLEKIDSIKIYSEPVPMIAGTSAILYGLI